MDRLPSYVREKISPEPMSGCWLWEGRIDDDGYGRIGWKGKTNVGAHRVVMELSGHVYPRGHDTDHLCKVRACVNPDHLEIVLPIENQKRVAPEVRRAAVEWRRAATHCVHGHEFTAANTYWRPTGQRTCRACNRASATKYQKRRMKIAGCPRASADPRRQECASEAAAGPLPNDQRFDERKAMV